MTTSMVNNFFVLLSNRVKTTLPFLKRYSDLPVKKYLFFFFLVYLAHEFAFNARLLDSNSGQASSLEYYGRTLAGTGAALLVFRKGYSLGWTIHKKILICTMAWLFVFFGQRILIDGLASSTSGQARADAQLLLLEAQALREGNISFPDLPVFIKNSPSRLKAYASCMALANWEDTNHLKRMREDFGKLARAISGKNILTNLDRNYEDYLKFVKKAQLLRQEALTNTPKLAYLVRKKARQLEKIPPGFKEIETTCQEFKNVLAKHGVDDGPSLTTFCNVVQKTKVIHGYVVPVERYKCVKTDQEVGQKLISWVEEKITQELNKKSGQTGIKIPMNQTLNFEEWKSLVGPQLIKLAEKNIRSRFLPAEKLMKDEEFAEKGQRFAKALIVPPLAILFSLFFALWNLCAVIAGKSYLRWATCLSFLALPLLIGPDVLVSGWKGSVLSWIVWMEWIVYPLGTILKYITFPAL